jgi:hypothetical protein
MKLRLVVPAVLLSLCMSGFAGYTNHWSYSANDCDNRLQDAIDLISGPAGVTKIADGIVDESEVGGLPLSEITNVTASADEVNLLDGATATAEEHNTLDSSETNTEHVMSLLRLSFPTSLARGTNYLSQTLPQNFIFCGGYIRLTTPATSTNADVAALSIGVLSDSDLQAGGDGGITNSTWGAAGTPELIPAIETPSTYIVGTGTANKVRAVASQAITQIVANAYIFGFKIQ